MAREITNSLRSGSIIRVHGASTETVELANLSVNTSVETVSAAEIKRVMWSTNGFITITRNSDTILSLYGSGDMPFSDLGHKIANNKTSPIVVVVTTGGTLVMEVSKECNYQTPLIGM